MKKYFWTMLMLGFVFFFVSRSLAGDTEEALEEKLLDELLETP